MPACPLGRELGCCRNTMTIKAVFALAIKALLTAEQANPPALRREQQSAW